MDLTLITSNVSADFLTPPGVPAWDARKDLYAQTVRAAAPDIVGFQEATPRQFAFWQEALPEFTGLAVEVTNPDPDMVATWQAKYAKFGLPTIPSPYEILVFYRTETFDCMETGYWWLSPTPARPSIGFGNVAPRVMLWAKLKHRDTGQEFIVFNTHLDHRALDAMVTLCRDQFTSFLGQAPLIFMGDLNINPTQPNFARLLEDGWHDSHPTGTNAGTFLYENAGVPDGRIDHILYHGPWTPLVWTRLESPDPARRLSDHNPVLARLSLDHEETHAE